MRWQVDRLIQRRRFPHLNVDNKPIVFINSFPKSGTHLLRQAVSGLSYLGPFVEAPDHFIPTYEVSTGSRRTQREILDDLKSLRPGDIQMGHLHATSENVAFLCRPEVVLYFLYRDPRDVVVSHAYFVTSMDPTHIHHDFYARKMTSLDERIRVSILGRPELQEIEFPDIQARFAPYIGWLDRDEALGTRFEDLLAKQRETLIRIWRHFQRSGFELDVSDEVALEALAKGIDPTRSPTFRSGKIGGWRENFSQENKALFKRVAGELLITLGYEKDLNW